MQVFWDKVNIEELTCLSHLVVYSFNGFEDIWGKHIDTTVDQVTNLHQVKPYQLNKVQKPVKEIRWYETLAERITKVSGFSV